MKYALIKDTKKVVAIKELDIDKVNLTISITSLKDEVYVEQYLTSDEVRLRLIKLNNGFRQPDIISWWDKI